MSEDSKILPNFLVMDEIARLNYILHLKQEQLVDLREWMFEYLEFNRLHECEELDLINAWMNIVDRMIVFYGYEPQ